MSTKTASKLAYNAARWGRRQRGFSLVELMISLVIGVILVYGAVRLLVDSRNTQRASESTADGAGKRIVSQRSRTGADAIRM